MREIDACLALSWGTINTANQCHSIPRARWNKEALEINLFRPSHSVGGESHAQGSMSFWWPIAPKPCRQLSILPQDRTTSSMHNFAPMPLSLLITQVDSGPLTHTRMTTRS